MRIVGYKQPQTVAAQKTEKPAAEGIPDGKPQANKTNGGNKPADGKK